jgi:hypothetical protein
MPRDITVTFDDGSNHVYKNAPDDATPEQVAARASQEFGKAVKALDGGKGISSPSVSDRLGAVGDAIVGTAKGAGKSLAAGAAKSWGGLLQLGSMGPEHAMIDPVSGKVVADTRPNAKKILADKLANWGKEVGQSSELGPWGKSIVEGVGGGLSVPVGGPLIAALTGATGGAGGEVGSRLSQGSELGRAAGSLAGGVGGGLVAARVASRATPQVGEIAKEAMEGLTPDMLKRAAEFQARSAERGVTVDLAQALEGIGVAPGNLRTLRDTLAGSKHGNSVQATLKSQPTDVENLAVTTMAGMPGAARDEGVAANNVAEAATGFINSLKKVRSDATKGLYAQAGDVGESTREQLVKQAQAMRDQPGITEGVRSGLNSFIGKISGTDPKLEAAVQTAREAFKNADSGSARLAAQAQLAAAKASQQAAKKPLHALDIDTAIGELTGAFKGTPLSPGNPKSLGQSKFAAKELDATLGGASTATKQAAAEHSRLSRDLVDPAKQSLAGQLATRAGYKTDVQASWAKFSGIMERGEVATASGSSEVRTLAKNLAKVDPEVFPDAVKTYLSGKIQAAFPPVLEGQISADPKAVGKLISGLGFDDSKRFNALRQATSAIAEQHGLPPKDVVRGLENFAQIAKATMSRPEKIGGMTREELQLMAGNNKAATALRMFGIAPLAGPARLLERMTLGQTLRRFDEILTSPEGARKLAELGRLPVVSREAQVLVASMGSAMTSAKTDRNTAE